MYKKIIKLADNLARTLFVLTTYYAELNVAKFKGEKQLYIFGNVNKLIKIHPV